MTDSSVVFMLEKLEREGRLTSEVLSQAANSVLDRMGRFSGKADGVIDDQMSTRFAELQTLAYMLHAGEALAQAKKDDAKAAKAEASASLKKRNSRMVPTADDPLPGVYFSRDQQLEIFEGGHDKKILEDLHLKEVRPATAKRILDLERTRLKSHAFNLMGTLPGCPTVGPTPQEFGMILRGRNLDAIKSIRERHRGGDGFVPDLKATKDLVDEWDACITKYMVY